MMENFRTTVTTKNGCHFAYDISILVVLSYTYRIFIQISMTFDPDGSIECSIGLGIVLLHNMHKSYPESKYFQLI